jgi:hypothetical protein
MLAEKFPNKTIENTQCSFLNLAMLCVILLLAGCSNDSNRFKDTGAEKIWYQVEYQDRTNDLPTAYRLSFDARNKLEEMSKTRPHDLDYTYCLAFLDARLFLMARSLGDTNAADEFLL